MARPNPNIHSFDDEAIADDAISPSVTIQRNRRLRTGMTAYTDLVYTEHLWAAANNTLAGCKEASAWRDAKHWLLVTDTGHRGEATAMLTGCESLAGPDASLAMIDAKRIPETLLETPATDATVVVLALEQINLLEAVKQLDVWMQTAETNDTQTVDVHLIWLPDARAEHTLAANDRLESLPSASLTTVCDLEKLSHTNADGFKESLSIMLRAALFIDAQFLHWIEGNLSALSEPDIERHKKAIMRAAHSIFTVKRNRSDEPELPMAFSTIRRGGVRNGPVSPCPNRTPLKCVGFTRCGKRCQRTGRRDADNR